MEIVSFWITVLGTFLTAAALLYAFRAARDARLAASRAESILDRTIIKPLRPLDQLYAALTEREKKVLEAVYRTTQRLGTPVRRDDIASYETLIGQPSRDELNFLAESGWIIQSGRDAWSFDVARASYMASITITTRSQE